MPNEYERYVLLDRDGVINAAPTNEYITSIDELTLLPGAADAIRKLNDRGFGVVVVSNQQCVAKGLLTLGALDDLTAHLTAMIREASGGAIVEYFYCPHLADAGCECRKPKPGLILQAQSKFGFERERTYVVGDSYKDLEAADAAGCPGIFVLTGNDAGRYRSGDAPRVATELVADDLAQAVEYIIGRVME